MADTFAFHPAILFSLVTNNGRRPYFIPSVSTASSGHSSQVSGFPIYHLIFFGLTVSKSCEHLPHEGRVGRHSGSLPVQNICQLGRAPVHFFPHPESLCVLNRILSLNFGHPAIGNDAAGAYLRRWYSNHARGGIGSIPRSGPSSTQKGPQVVLRSSPLSLSLECIHIAAARFHQQLLKLLAILDGHLYLFNQFIWNIQRCLPPLRACVQRISGVPFSTSAHGTVRSNTSILAQTQRSARQRPKLFHLFQEPPTHVFGKFIVTYMYHTTHVHIKKKMGVGKPVNA
jgi:hypothetical protein